MTHTSILTITLVFLLGCSANMQIGTNAAAPGTTPEQVVVLFQQTYGTADMDRLGPYTTARFRKGRPIAVWLVDVWKHLEGLHYEKLAFRIMETETNASGNEAQVTVASAIKTNAGTTTQTEIFILVRDGGIWRIDELFVTDEEIQGENDLEL